MSQKIRKERITKREWYDLGGFANPALFRQQSRGGAWRYYMLIGFDRLTNVDYSEIEKRLLATMTEPPNFEPRKIGTVPELGTPYGNTGRYRK